jgi:hypothetical protein
MSSFELYRKGGFFSVESSREGRIFPSLVTKKISSTIFSTMAAEIHDETCISATSRKHEVSKFPRAETGKNHKKERRMLKYFIYVPKVLL